ncbi:transcription elongation factor, mitochondrial isoform X2 [Anthonomus grandis grandis]|uniref:transcription elongation factor, mitochondrial isoform X2 n=1 Tax=Anthonomus grandis grandis TaxID=2921223 RepID=UPI002166BF08|nr:transcription elongation factor, mitochondrial isoform X2 [Anthonomus grandis grandis]
MSGISLLGNECRFLPFVRKLCSQTRKTNTISATLADYKIQFSEGTGQKILDTMNKSSPDDLSKYKISNVNIKNLIDWKKERGPFKTLSDPLEVDGFDVQLLLEFYKSMGSIKVTQSKRKSHGSGNEKHLIRPELKPNLISSLQSAVAIHLESIGIGWVRLDRSSKVTHWNCEQFSSLPDKMWPVDTFNLAVSLLKKTPPSDVYIFEKSNSLSPQSKTKPLMVSSHSQHLELLSMLMALLNSSSIHNPESNLINNPPTIENKVFYLKNKMTARLFGTLIGSERVSAIPLSLFPEWPIFFNSRVQCRRKFLQNP